MLTLYRKNLNRIIKSFARNISLAAKLHSAKIRPGLLRRFAPRNNEGEEACQATLLATADRLLRCREQAAQEPTFHHCEHSEAIPVLKCFDQTQNLLRCARNDSTFSCLSTPLLPTLLLNYISSPIRRAEFSLHLRLKKLSFLSD